MKVKVATVRVIGYDSFKDAQFTADFINKRAMEAGLASTPLNEKTDQILEFLEREIVECDEDIQKKLIIEFEIVDIEE